MMDNDGSDNDGLENDGLENDGLDNDGLDNDGLYNEGIWTPILYMVPWAHPSPQPKRHLDRFSLFC